MSLALAGCVQQARIATPAELAATTERMALTGMGGWERGRFRLGASAGRFTRAAIQERHLLGLEQHNFGGGRFEVEGPDFESGLSAECRYDEVEHRLGSLSVPAERFAYRCLFSRNGEPIEARLVLAERPSRPGELLSGRTRGGAIEMDGRVLTIRAIHDMAEGRLPTMEPLGYAFETDGRPVGAIDLNGGEKTILVPRGGPDREIVLAASLALAILWDPAALDD